MTSSVWDVNERLTCQLCGRTKKDLLFHLRLDHGVTDVESYLVAMEREVTDLQRKLDFRKAVEEWKAKVSDGTMTPEEYRRRVMVGSAPPPTAKRNE